MLSEPDTFLPAAKARLARRMVLAGRSPEPAGFRARGLDLSASEWRRLETWAAAPLASRVERRVASADRSLRLVVRLADGEVVETVVLPDGAVCVSTQVGCAVGCRFCASGLDGLRRNLECWEIVEQVAHARRTRSVDRVVYMGIGEPTHNLAAVVAAAGALQREAMIPPRRQTLSTVGSVARLARLAAAPVRPVLALSLHAADPELRRRLLPRAGDDDLTALVRAADAYGRRVGAPVQVAWTVLAGINDRDRDVDALCELLSGVRGYVNFIPWNPVAELPFERPDRAHVVEMVRRVRARGIVATLRSSAGADARAACGQLRRG